MQEPLEIDEDLWELIDKVTDNLTRTFSTVRELEFASHEVRKIMIDVLVDRYPDLKEPGWYVDHVNKKVFFFRNGESRDPDDYLGIQGDISQLIAFIRSLEFVEDEKKGYFNGVLEALRSNFRELTLFYLKYKDKNETKEELPSGADG